MKQSSLQLDDDTRRMIGELAEWWGLSPQRHNTQVIQKCVARVWFREQATREIAAIAAESDE